MQFHFEKTLEKRFEPQNQVADGTPAWRVLWLAKALRDWFGQPHRTFYQSGSCQVQFGYEALSFPVSDFASFFGAMVGGIGRVWPVQVFGLGDGNELVELSVIEDNGTFAQRRKVKDFFIKFTKKSHSADFLTEQTLDFVLHRLFCGLAEMHTDDIGCLSDLLSDSRASGGVGCGIVHSKSSCK